MSFSNDLPSLRDPVPLFPLPNVVLLPGGTLPLQIFEPRYLAMMNDVLEDDGVMAMALLLPGYESHYHTNLAEIHPVVCVGRVREHVQLPDKRFLINLTGACRARVRQEDRDGEYRRATLDAMIIPASSVETDGEYAARQELATLLEYDVFDHFGGIERIRDLLGDATPLADVTDLIGACLLPQDAVEIRLSLLEEMRVLERAEILRRELSIIRKMLEVKRASRGDQPPYGSAN